MTHTNENSKYQTIHDVILDPKLHSKREIQERMAFYNQIMQRTGEFFWLLDTDLHNTLINHPQITSEVARTIATENRSLKSAIYRLPVFPEQDLLDLVSKEPGLHLKNYAKSWRLLTEFPEWRDAFQQQKNMSKRDFNDVGNLLLNPNIPQGVLHALVCDNDAKVRKAVARNTNLSDETLAILKRDMNDEVQEALLENPLVPSDFIQRYIWDHRFKTSAPHIAKNPNLTAVHISAMIDHHASTGLLCVNLMKHPNFDAVNYGQILQRAATEKHLLYALLDHPLKAQYCAEIREFLRKDRDILDYGISLLPDATPKELSGIIKRGLRDDSISAYHAVSHPHADKKCVQVFFDTWKEVLHNPQYNEHIETVVAILFNQPNTSQEILDYLVSTIPYSVAGETNSTIKDVQVMLATIPHMKPSHLKGLLLNEHTPRALLPIIRERAETFGTMNNLLRALFTLREKYEV